MANFRDTFNFIIWSHWFHPIREFGICLTKYWLTICKNLFRHLYLRNLFSLTSVFLFVGSAITRCLSTTPLPWIEQGGSIRLVTLIYDLWWREHWSSFYGRRLMFQKSWVQIQAPYTGWTFSHLFVVKNVMFVWKDKNKHKKSPGMAHIFKNKKSVWWPHPFTLNGKSENRSPTLCLLMNHEPGIKNGNLIWH